MIWQKNFDVYFLSTGKVRIDTTEYQFNERGVSAGKKMRRYELTPYKTNSFILRLVRLFREEKHKAICRPQLDGWTIIFEGEQ